MKLPTYFFDDAFWQSQPHLIWQKLSALKDLSFEQYTQVCHEILGSLDNKAMAMGHLIGEAHFSKPTQTKDLFFELIEKYPITDEDFCAGLVRILKKTICEQIIFDKFQTTEKENPRAVLQETLDRSVLFLTRPSILEEKKSTSKKNYERRRKIMANVFFETSSAMNIWADPTGIDGLHQIIDAFEKIPNTPLFLESRETIESYQSSMARPPKDFDDLNYLFGAVQQMNHLTLNQYVRHKDENYKRLMHRIYHHSPQTHGILFDTVMNIDSWDANRFLHALWACARAGIDPVSTEQSSPWTEFRIWMRENKARLSRKDWQKEFEDYDAMIERIDQFWADAQQKTITRAIDLDAIKKDDASGLPTRRKI